VNSEASDPISASLAVAAERRETLVALLRGRAVPAATPSGPARRGSFDGGARQRIPVRRDPVSEHHELLVELLLRARAGGRGGLGVF
jgi:hypothetical protein